MLLLLGLVGGCGFWAYRACEQPSAPPPVRIEETNSNAVALFMDKLDDPCSPLNDLQFVRFLGDWYLEDPDPDGHFMALDSMPQPLLRIRRRLDSMTASEPIRLRDLLIRNGEC